MAKDEKLTPQTNKQTKKHVDVRQKPTQYCNYLLIKNKRETLSTAELDQTSTTSNIQTDLRFSIAGLDTINLIADLKAAHEDTPCVYLKKQFCLHHQLFQQLLLKPPPM